MSQKAPSVPAGSRPADRDRHRAARWHDAEREGARRRYPTSKAAQRRRGIEREDAGRQERAGHQVAGRVSKSKSMSSETETKGGKDMKAEGRDSKTGMEQGGADATARHGRQQERHRPDQGRQDQGADHGQRRHLGDRSPAGREAHPDRLRHQVGEASRKPPTSTSTFRLAPPCLRPFASTRCRPGSSRSIRSGVATR